MKPGGALQSLFAANQGIFLSHLLIPCSPPPPLFQILSPLSPFSLFFVGLGLENFFIGSSIVRTKSPSRNNMYTVELLMHEVQFGLAVFRTNI